ncbi:SNF-related serine/threonine-protein kinase-like [Phlebotomus argentipes]|uniref:SNF-related serine/threonine-protein kinase-like n=1 Tax=Phlebotomus argentipes TaxID=94469 RepID=UPI0028933980|nr:SNF-related serine/threonine-protein kinase-like [Phlebotomus argentipes]
MHGMASSRVGVYDGKIAGLYDLEETLGSGHFAVVKLARHVFTGEKVAVKVIDKTKLDEVSRAHLFQEVRCMKLVQHPNVVRLYEVIDTQTKLYLILELGDGGDLYDYIMKHEAGLSESLARDYFRQIVRAISYCHQLHVVHRDLKPENVVFFEKLGVVKLTDFGFSNKFCPGQKLETSCGSLAYSAPEILLGDSYDAPAVDIWSLGVILYMLVCGQPPFQEANDSETLTMIMDCKYTMPIHISMGCRSLISKMLVREPDKRATLNEISQDTWLMEGGPDHGPEYLPLVSREQVSEDDHTLIIQKIVNGKIATKDEILEALDKNEYNHITATYFLLAERKLRAHRQEQAQKRKPELTLPVSGAGRLSPRSRGQGVKRESQEDKDSSHQHLLVPSINATHLNLPRTPGVEGSQTGRARKCSIVQEDDEEDEISACSGREELSVPLNRRGSRSEGRINIAIQDRIAAESERLMKKDVSAGAAKGCQVKKVDGISGVTVITSDSSNPMARLGMSAVERQRLPLEMLNKSVAALKDARSNSVDHENYRAGDQEMSTMKVLTDSSTITIPITSQGGGQCAEFTNVPKYKTMPSPTRGLNEIFEEATDVGSDTSGTTTPRPIQRHNQFTNSRAQSQGAAQRRSKFNKTRTASCSSSDASDDDSENRKKRAHKIVDSVTKPVQQRRDSHDDSSDSQEPGNAPASGGAGAHNGTHPLVKVTSPTNTTGGQNSTGGGGSGTSAGGQQKAGNGQSMGFRRHRAGRRRASETRLRESQSLNRITEVQESEPTVPPMLIAAAAAQPPATTPTSGQKPKGFSARFLQGFRKSEATSPMSSGGAQQDSNDNDVEMVLGVELVKALKVSNSTETKTSSTTKKLKMLGKYFQVHKKLCIPLPNLFQRGRLYKAQSCGSLVRDKVNQAPSGGGGSGSRSGRGSESNVRHSALFSDRDRILRNCLGASRLLGSDGDINQNDKTPTNPVVFSMPAQRAEEAAAIHLDASLCRSQC